MLSSELALRVWVQAEEDWPPRPIGLTPSEEPLAGSPSVCWWVEPLAGSDLAAVARELDAQRVPGLRLSRFPSHHDLALLKELEGLHALYLSQATDSGLAQLKDFKGLRRLRLRNARVTDAGVAELQRALPSVRAHR